MEQQPIRESENIYTALVEAEAAKAVSETEDGREKEAPAAPISPARAPAVPGPSAGSKPSKAKLRKERRVRSSKGKEKETTPKPTKGAPKPKPGLTLKFPQGVSTSQVKAVSSQPAASVKSSPGPQESTVAANIRRFRVAVADNSAEKRVLEGLHVPVRIRDDMQDTTHPASAKLRQWMVAQAYAKLHALGAINVLAVQGAKWHREVVTFLNQGVPDKKKINLTIFQVADTPKGITRFDPEAVHDIGAPGAYDGYLFVDLYQLQGAPLNPVNLSGIIGLSPAIWIGHQFTGAYGTTCGEGGWIRVRSSVEGTEAEYICHRSDLQEPTRQLHDPLDWLKVEGTTPLASGHLVWAPNHPIGPMVDVIIRQQRDKPYVLAAPPVEARHAWVKLPLPDGGVLTEWLLTIGKFAPVEWLMPASERLVDRDLQRRLMAMRTYRQFSPYSWRAIANMAAQEVTKDPDMVLLAKLFPESLPEVVSATALAAFVARASREADEAEWMNHIHGRSMQRYNLATAAIGVAPVRPWWKQPKYVAAGASLFVVAVGMCAYWARHRGSLASAAQVARDLAPEKVEGRTVWERCKATALSVLTAPFRAAWTWADDKAYGLALAVMRRSPTLHERWGLFLGDVFVEEVFKGSFPGGHVLLALGEYLLKAFLGYQTGNRGWMLSAVLPFLMHMAISVLPIWLRIPLHTAWNLMMIDVVAIRDMPEGACPRIPAPAIIRTGMLSAALSVVFHRSDESPVVNPWTAFRGLYYDAPWSVRGDWPVTEHAAHTPFPPEEGVVRKETQSHFAPAEKDTTLKLKSTLLADPDEKASTFIYFILPTMIPVYSPARTDANLLAVFEGRLMTAPVLDPQVQSDHWRALRKFPSALLRSSYPIIVWEDHVTPWFDNITEPFKKRRAIRALQQYKEHGLKAKDREYISNEVIVKTDEVLLRNRGGQVELKPRPVVNVDAVVQVETGPCIFEAAKRLHDEWAWSWEATGGDCLRLGAMEIRITFGSNATDRKLSDWWQEAEAWVTEPRDPGTPRRAWILVAGDDSLVVLQTADGYRLVEGDFGMFDQTESFGPLTVENILLQLLGVPALVTDRLLRSSCARYVGVGRTGKVKLVHKHRPMRVTGGADTTCGNSGVNAIAWAFVLLRLWDGSDPELVDQLETAMRWLGFELKCRLHTDIRQATFLKGIWVDLEGGTHPVWAPLPSRILKLGKSLTDPCAIYRSLDRKAAGAQFLNDVASSYRLYARVPVLGAFVARFYEREALRDFALQEPWKVSAGWAESPGVVVNAAGLAAHYGLREEELWDLDSLIRQASPYEFLVHPALAALARVDYN